MALALVLYKNACLLALDEATAHLDANCERQANKALRRLGPTRILIAHGPETVVGTGLEMDLGILPKSAHPTSRSQDGNHPWQNDKETPYMKYLTANEAHSVAGGSVLGDIGAGVGGYLGAEAGAEEGAMIGLGIGGPVGAAIGAGLGAAIGAGAFSALGSVISHYID